jgi:hypothetical protein
MLKPFTLSGAISCNDEGRLSPALAKRQRTTRLIVVVVVVVVVIIIASAAAAAWHLDGEQLAVLSGGGVRRECRPRLRRGRVVRLDVEQPPVLSEHMARVDDP